LDAIRKTKALRVRQTQLQNGARLLYDVINAYKYEQDAGTLQEYAYSTGFTKEMMQKFEGLIKRDELMKLIDMHKEGIPFDLKDTQNVLDLLEDTKISEELRAESQRQHLVAQRRGTGLNKAVKSFALKHKPLLTNTSKFGSSTCKLSENGRDRSASQVSEHSEPVTPNKHDTNSSFINNKA